ncbi:MAG: hypothetical protein Q9187_000561 [Circinaria calcarea]
MTTVNSSVVGLAGEAYLEEKERIPDASKLGVGHSSTSSSDPETTQEEDAAPVRTVASIKWFFAYSSVIASVLLFALDNTIVADI